MRLSYRTVKQFVDEILSKSGAERVEAIGELRKVLQWRPVQTVIKQIQDLKTVEECKMLLAANPRKAAYQAAWQRIAAIQA